MLHIEEQPMLHFCKIVITMCVKYLILNINISLRYSLKLTISH